MVLKFKLMQFYSPYIITYSTALMIMVPFEKLNKNELF